MMHCPKCGREAVGDAVFCSACGAKIAPSQTRAATPPGIFKFACPHCGQRIAVKIEWSGRYAKCPGCGNTIQIPSPETVVDPQPAASIPTAPPPVQNERKAVIPPPPVRNEQPPEFSAASVRPGVEQKKAVVVSPAVKLAPRPATPAPKLMGQSVHDDIVDEESGNKEPAAPVPHRPVLRKVPSPVEVTQKKSQLPPVPRPVVISAPFEPGKIRPVLRPVNCSGHADEGKDQESFRPVLRTPKK